jgi:hypothetical protein
MRARDAGVDHHHVVAAVTHGLTNSAKDLTAPEADAVLHALVDIKAGRALLEDDGDGGWRIVDPADQFAEDPNPDEEPRQGETRTQAYQRRIRELKAKKTELDRGGQQALPDPDDED